MVIGECLLTIYVLRWLLANVYYLYMCLDGYWRMEERRRQRIFVEPLQGKVNRFIVIYNKLAEVPGLPVELKKLIFFISALVTPGALKDSLKKNFSLLGPAVCIATQLKRHKRVLV